MDITFVREKIDAVNSPKQVVEGSTLYIKTHWWDLVTSATAIAYRRKTNVTSVVFPSGSIVVSNNTVILKPMTSLVGGKTYVVVVSATINNAVRSKKIKIQVAKDEAWQ